MFDAAKFDSKVAGKETSVEAIAVKIGISPSTLYRKINGQTDFKRCEILEISRILNLTKSDIMTIFFA